MADVSSGQGDGRRPDPLSLSSCLSEDERYDAMHDSNDMLNTLRSVGSVFTMTGSGFSASSSWDMGELAHQVVAGQVDAAGSRHVWFNSPLNTVRAVTPYSNIYGIHPRFFDVDAGGTMRLTPVGHMLDRDGLSQVLRGRAHSCPPRSSSSDFVVSGSAVLPPEPLSLGGPACSLTQECMSPLPQGISVTELLLDPLRSLELFQQQQRETGHLSPFMEHRALLNQHIADANALNEDIRSLRARVADSKEQFAHMQGECAAGTTCGDDSARTLSPEQLQHVTEIERLQAMLREKILALYRVRDKGDRVHVLLERDAIKMQKDFNAWQKSLRRTARSRSR